MSDASRTSWRPRRLSNPGFDPVSRFGSMACPAFMEGATVPQFDVAHVREQGIDLIVIPLDDSFGRRPQSNQRAAAHELQLKANSAGLRGQVVPVWATSSGAMGFLAPPNWHAFFRSIGFGWVAANINRTLSW
jgi:hypothetical protein